MQTSEVVKDMRKRAERLREIGMLEENFQMSRGIAEIADDVDRQADALEKPIIEGKLKLG